MSRADQQRRRIKRRAKRLDSRTLGHLTQSEPLQSLRYEITSDRLDVDHDDQAAFDSISSKARRALHDRIYSDPASCVPRLRSRVDQFPICKVFRNWLAMAHSGAGDNDSAEREVRELYHRHPNYFFAKAGIAQFALDRGDLEEVERIFGHKFDLKLLYSHRDLFHISEALTFNVIMVEYWLRKGQHHVAQVYFDMMLELDEEHPITLKAKEVMQGSRLLLRVRQWAQNFLALRLGL